MVWALCGTSNFVQQELRQFRSRMLTAAVLVGLLAFVSGHGNNNMMGGSMGGNYGQGMYGNNNQMWGQMGMGNSGIGNNGMNNNNLLRYLLGGSMGGNMQGNGGNMGGNMQGNGGYMGGNMQGNKGNMGGNYGNQMGGQMGGMGGQQGMMGGIMFMLLHKMLQSGDGRGDKMGQEETEAVEEMMKKKMMMEMADMLMMHMEFKEKEAEFAKSMEYMCYMVNATYAAYKKNGTEVFQETTDEMIETLGKQSEQMSDEERMNWSIDMALKEERKFSEIFLRFATWACYAGDDYMKYAMKKEKMEKGQGECERD